MNIVATAVEPEFVTLEVEQTAGLQPIGGHLTLDIARFQVAGNAPFYNGEYSGTLQVILMASDVNTIIDTLVRKGLVKRT